MAACTKTVTMVSTAVFRRLVTPFCESFGIEVILETDNKVKKMAWKSRQSGASDASALR